MSGITVQLAIISIERPPTDAYENYYYGTWNGPVHADDVMCNGTEYNPFDCPVDETPDPECQYNVGLAAVTCEQGEYVQMWFRI